METGPTQLTDTDCNELKSVRRNIFYTLRPSLPLAAASSQSWWNTKWQAWSYGIIKGCWMVLLSKNWTASCLLLFCFGHTFGRGGKRQDMLKNNAVWPTGREDLSVSALRLGLKQRGASSRPFCCPSVCAPHPSPSVWSLCTASQQAALLVWQRGWPFQQRQFVLSVPPKNLC